MQLIWRLFLVLLLYCLSCKASGQIHILHPFSRLVLQRGLDNKAQLVIAGYTSGSVTKIEYQLAPQGGKLIAWKILTESLGDAEFAETIAVTSGWYDLYLRAWNNTTLVEEKLIDRIGVGEVFLIAGQSNAMGVQGLGSKDVSDRVNVIDRLNKRLDNDITVAPNEPMTLRNVSRGRATTSVYPSGDSSWLWGELADLIVQKHNVPVFFLNCGWAAATSENWSQSAKGNLAYNQYVGKYWPNYQPYANVRNSLKYITAQTGIRAILWQQGESDAAHNEASARNYRDNLQYVINKTRADFGYNLPWAVARSSVSVRSEWSKFVIMGQDSVIQVPYNIVFKGPNTDTIQIPRPEHGHFENTKTGIQGLTLAAKAWMNALDSTFFKKAQPYQPVTTLVPRILPSVVPFDKDFRVYFTGATTENKIYKVELLDTNGEYLLEVGQGTGSPVVVKIPSGLALEKYRLRVVSDAPFAASTLSNTFGLAASWTPLVSFTMEEKEDEIFLKWTFITGYSAKNYVLQVSYDGKTYQDIYSLNAESGNFNSGEWKGKKPFEVFTFYRLKMLMPDGSTLYSSNKEIIDYSKVLANEPQVAENNILYPNPTSDELFSKPQQIIRQLHIVDINGKEQQGWELEKQDNCSKIKLPKNWANGIYFATIIYTDGTTAQSKILLIKN